MGVRAKTAKRNRTSRQASLRKTVASVTPRRKAKTRTASPAARSTATGTHGAGRFALAPRTVVVGTLCVVAAAALLMGRPSSRTWEVMAVDEAGNVERLESVANADAIDPEVLIDRAVALPRSSALTASSSPAPVAPPRAIEPAPAAAASESISKPAVSPDATMKMISPPAPVASQSASTVAPAAEAEEPATPVTLAGCVERNGEGFSLKNASGEGAPSSRSWKSGFLRKRSQSVTLIDRGYTHRLATYVGQRVETTGVLADREMRVKTLRVLGSCD